MKCSLRTSQKENTLSGGCVGGAQWNCKLGITGRGGGVASGDLLKSRLPRSESETSPNWLMNHRAFT